MTSPPDRSDILSAVADLVTAGVSVHWLRRRDKAPLKDEWTDAPFQTLDDLSASWARGQNIGVRLGERSHTAHGYLHLIDLDIRDFCPPDEVAAAWAWIRGRWPAVDAAPFVISGSGGESRHLYFFTDRPFRSRKLQKSAGWRMVWDEKKQREVKRHDWEIEIFGTRKQAVLPPSLHPDTGLPYVWGRKIEWDLLDLGIGPIVPGEVVESWGVSEDDLNLGEEEDDLFALVRSQPMGLSEQEIEHTIRDLPEDWVDDRDGWLTVGQALHHEYQGSAAGFERWCEWSKQSGKYDARDQATVWKSFKGARKPVRMASLIKAAGEARLARAHREAGLLDDMLSLPLSAGTALVPLTTQDDDLLSLDPQPKAAAKASGRPEPEYDPEWRSYLHRTDEGQIKPTLHNVELIVRNDVRFRGVIGWNEFTQEIVLVRRPGRMSLKKDSPKPVRQLEGPIWNLGDQVNGDLWTTSHDVATRLILETPERQGGYALKTSDRDLVGAVNRAAQANRFHPVRDYLDGLEWDGVNRVEGLFTDYLGAERSPYHREAAVLFLVGAVTRIYEPGHKFDFVPILEGLQGVRKSSFIRAIARNWFAELEGDFHDTKGMVERMQGAWVIEMPELQGFSKAEVTTIKGFVSRPVDKVRLAYEKRAMNFPRQCVFIGSTNELEYLRDATGGRRFWPIACRVTEIDTDRLRGNIDQIWAEAKAMYDAWRTRHPAGELPLYLRDVDAAAEAKALQESRRQETVEETLAARIQEWLDKPIGSDLGFDDMTDEEPEWRNEFCLYDIWVEMMGRDLKDYDSRNQQVLGRAVRLLPGWYIKGRDKSAKYGRQRMYARLEPR